MKKILAVLIAISMIATMAFAADAAFSVNVAAKGSVVEVKDFSSAKDATLLNQDDEGRVDWGNAGSTVKIALSAADEKASAGVTLNITKDAKLADSTSLWIKPIDMLKLTFFSDDANVGADRNGNKYGNVAGNYGVELTPVAGLTVKAVLGAGINFKGAPAGGALVSYSNDTVGTLKVTSSFGNAVAATAEKREWKFAQADGKDKDGKEYKAGATIVEITAAKPATRYQVAVGYASPKIADMVNFNVLWQIDDTNYVANNKVLENATVAAGPVTVFEEFEFVLTGKELKSIPADVKVSAAFGAASCAVEAEWASIKEAGKLTITPSATYAGTCGAAGWSLGLEVPVAIDNGAKVGLKVPYSVSLAF